MAKFRGTATVVWYFEAADRPAASRAFDHILDDLLYQDAELEEIDEEEFAQEASK